MEYIKCPYCGGETPIILGRCRHCGQRRPEKAVIEQTFIPKERNGFVTFWLTACFIVNLLLSFGYFALLFSSRGLWSGTPEPLLLRLFWILGVIANTVGYWMLLSWKKVGFNILIGAALANGFVNFCISLSAFSIFIAFASIIILYFILQISKNGKTCWEQLS